MKVYKPVFDRKWLIEELESDLLRRIPGTNDTVCYYKKNVGFYGPLYNVDNFFKTREAAQMWIDKEVVPQGLFYSIDKQEDRNDGSRQNKECIGKYESADSE